MITGHGKSGLTDPPASKALSKDPPNKEIDFDGIFSVPICDKGIHKDTQVGTF